MAQRVNEFPSRAEQAFLAGPAIDAAAAAIGPVQNVTALVGHRVGAYEIRSVLGAGGMGARRLLQILQHPPSGIWLDPAMMGSAYGAIGDIDRAITWYDKGIEERAPNMIYMKVGVQ